MHAANLIRRAYSLVRISGVAFWTGAFVAADQIDAFRSVAAYGSAFGTLVDVRAGTVLACEESFRAGTITETARDGNALRSVWALPFAGAASQDAARVDDPVRRLTLTLEAIAFFAERERVSVESWWALAIVASGHVFADSVQTACGLLPQLRTFVYVPAFPGGDVASITARAYAEAFADELVLYALFSGRAFLFRSASKR